MQTNDWNDLEEQVATLLKNDYPKRPGNSGGTKKEEDVIGKSTITQCKYTDKKNMSILRKDLDRLVDACTLQEKFPLFITSTGDKTVASFPIDKTTSSSVKYILDLIVFLQRAKQLRSMKPSSIRELNLWKEELKKLKKVQHGFCKKIFETMKILYNQETSTEDNLMMYDLFEGEKNAS